MGIRNWLKSLKDTIELGKEIAAEDKRLGVKITDERIEELDKFVEEWYNEHRDILKMEAKERRMQAKERRAEDIQKIKKAIFRGKTR